MKLRSFIRVSKFFGVRTRWQAKARMKLARYTLTPAHMAVHQRAFRTLQLAQKKPRPLR